MINHYEIHDGLFYHHLGGRTYGPFESIGIGCHVTDGRILLLRHGDYREVRKYMNIVNKHLASPNTKTVTLEICHCDLNILNHFINTSALPEIWLEKLAGSQATRKT